MPWRTYRLKPGSSAVIVYVEMKWIDKALERLNELGAEVIHETLDNDQINVLSGKAL